MLSKDSGKSSYALKSDNIEIMIGNETIIKLFSSLFISLQLGLEISEAATRGVL